MAVQKRIVVLTGAGISAESGLATFRASDGLWEDHRVEDVATPEAFARNPVLVQRFYNMRRRQLFDTAVQPNAAHLALARLQAAPNVSLTLITQNVDNLHERAGSDNVLHMHGELLKIYCLACNKSFAWEKDCLVETPCPNCAQVGYLRPDIVWFGEMPYHMGEIDAALHQADVFVAIGTSGMVYPAAGFVRIAASVGAHCVEINLAPSGSATLFDNGYYGEAGTQVPRWVEAVLA